jgi:hypothetical protein
MKTLKEYILEGAAIADRSYDRFFGDKLGRDKDVKKSIAKSMMTLKKYKSDFSADEYKMLEELIDNKQIRYRESRSYVSIRSYYSKRDEHEFLTFSFAFRMNNLPKSITNQIDKGITRKHPNLTISCDLHSFGITQTLSGNIDYYDKNKGSNEDVISAIKDILSTIKPIYNDLISFKDDDADREEVNRRQRDMM